MKIPCNQNKNILRALFKLSVVLYALCLPIETIGSNLPVQTNGPIHIESDNVIFLQNPGTITYEGHVIVTSQEQTLTAEKVIVHRDNNQAISAIIAFGAPAHYHQIMPKTQTPIHAYATEIHYHPDAGLLTLTGQAKITHQQNTFEGPVLKYTLEDQKIEAIHTANERPKMTLFPPQKS